MYGFIQLIFDTLTVLFVANDVTEIIISSTGNTSEITKAAIEDHVERLALAEAGDTVSQYKIGKAYINGDGVKQNYAEALRWLSIAAERGYADAQSTVGRMYFMGEGTQRNNEEAFFWYSVAARDGGKPKEWAGSVARYLKPNQISAVNKRMAE